MSTETKKRRRKPDLPQPGSWWDHTELKKGIVLQTTDREHAEAYAAVRTRAGENVSVHESHELRDGTSVYQVTAW